LKKVLIITYYWPPSGGSPVLRWLKFVKYLPEFGWQPIIFTPENPTPQAFDKSLGQDIPETVQTYRYKILEPANLFGLKKTGKVQPTGFISEGNKKSLLKEVMIWIRGNFFIPDARMLWIAPASKQIIKLLKKEPVDAIISTGPPHSMHLIASRVKRKTNLPWIADFRDPWTKIDFYKELKLTNRSDRKHHKLEKKVLFEADKVITVGPTMTKEFIQQGCNHVSTITNGFDVELRIDSNIQKTEKFTILHVGSMPESRNPRKLWPVLSKLCKENQEFALNLEIKLIGRVDYSIISDIKQCNLEKYLHRLKQVSNSEALEQMRKASLLLLVVNNTHNAKGILTNKFFEYLSAGRPILTIGPSDGDVAKILKDSNAGSIYDYTDSERLKIGLEKYYMDFSNNDLKAIPTNIEKFSRRNLTYQLSQELDIIHKNRNTTK
jgi:glycosyltransferase involved in cell wall biosynthesis